MHNSSAALTPFEQAAIAVETWLDGAGAAFASRTKQPDSRRKIASWDIQLQHAIFGLQRVRFSILRDFPATPPQIHVDNKLCLLLPHIEMDGRFCHDVESSPKDYEYPAGAVIAVLQSLEKFWADTSDIEWIQKELHRERLSYWLSFCEQFRIANHVPTPRVVRVVMPPLNGIIEGRVAAYFRHSQRSRSELMLVSAGDDDPHVTAVRHDWQLGTLVRGHALFIPISQNVSWTPRDWPRNFHELESLVAEVTNHERSVTHWIESQNEDEPHPFLVVLIQESVCYGYLVSPALVSRMTSLRIIPVAIERVDADWALARDHQLPALRMRRDKRILLLGCGSLGSPVAELIARAGIGELHVLDKEVFESENCARHVLGAGDIGLSKSSALAKRLRQLVPGLHVKYYQALAADWVRDVCKPGTYDLVVDCTGESSIRVMLSHYSNLSLGNCPLVHAWMEPFCAATHVVYLAPGEIWPADDPGEKIAAASWPERTLVNLPACGASFHPYGAADAWQAAGFTSERLLSIIDGNVTTSTVWSWMRSKAFYEALGVDVGIGPLVPDTDSVFDSIQLTRQLNDVLGDG